MFELNEKKILFYKYPCGVKYDFLVDFSYLNRVTKNH